MRREASIDDVLIEEREHHFLGPRTDHDNRQLFREASALIVLNRSFQNRSRPSSLVALHIGPRISLTFRFHRRFNNVVMDVGPLAVTVEDHDEFSGSVEGRECVRRHGSELGSLASLNNDLAISEREEHPSLHHEEPVVTGVDFLLQRPAVRSELHFDGSRAASGSAEEPGCGSARTIRGWTDNHILVVIHVEESIEVNLKGRRKWQKNIQTDSPFAGLDPANGRRAEIGACGEVVK